MKYHRHTGLDSPRVQAKSILDMILAENVMLTTTAQTVAGIKTHTSIPVLPASDPTADNEMARKKYLDDFTANTVVATDDYLQESADTERTIAWNQATYIKKKDIRVEEAGTIRIKFDMKDGNGAGGCFGKVYKNGVAVGVEREETVSEWTTYSEDFTSDGNEEDFQLYMKYDDSGGGNGGYTRNFRIYYFKKLTITVGTINTN